MWMTMIATKLPRTMRGTFTKLKLLLLLHHAMKGQQPKFRRNMIIQEIKEVVVVVVRKYQMN
jgi:hypothetical protein